MSAKVQRTDKSVEITDAVVEFSANPSDVDSSLKLMDHSWLTNDYLNLFIKRLKEKPARVVWAGDYGSQLPTNKFVGLS